MSISKNLWLNLQTFHQNSKMPGIPPTSTILMMVSNIIITQTSLHPWGLIWSQSHCSSSIWIVSNDPVDLIMNLGTLTSRVTKIYAEFMMSDQPRFAHLDLRTSETSSRWLRDSMAHRPSREGSSMKKIWNQLLEPILQTWLTQRLLRSFCK